MAERGPGCSRAMTAALSCAAEVIIVIVDTFAEFLRWPRFICQVCSGMRPAVALAGAAGLAAVSRRLEVHGGLRFLRGARKI